MRWVALLGMIALTGCGARTGLEAPGFDGGTSPGPSYCQGTPTPPILVVTDRSQMFRFDPPSASFELVGTLACPDGSGPETMAVDHHDTAYVTYQDGGMFMVSAGDASCAQTPFSDGANDGRFGSCFASDPGGQGETLFLIDSAASPNGDLLRVDPQTFAVTTVGPLSTFIGSAELTGTGDGRLFAFGDQFTGFGAGQGSLAEVDPASGNVLSDVPVDIAVDGGFAFAFWGGSFYFFAGDAAGDTSVARRDADGTFDASYAVLPGQNVVGAGVSTCAPLE